MEYMQNQMDNLIIASEHYYDAFCDELDKKIQTFIDDNRYTCTVEYVYEEYRNHCKGKYIRYASKKIIENFKTDLAKATGINPL